MPGTIYAKILTKDDNLQYLPPSHPTTTTTTKVGNTYSQFLPFQLFYSLFQLIHSYVVDTAIVFPHRKGPPYKRALKTLMLEYMQKFIQDNIG